MNEKPKFKAPVMASEAQKQTQPAGQAKYEVTICPVVFGMRKEEGRKILEDHLNNMASKGCKLVYSTDVNRGESLLVFERT